MYTESYAYRMLTSKIQVIYKLNLAKDKINGFYYVFE